MDIGVAVNLRRRHILFFIWYFLYKISFLFESPRYVK